jgi:hypothetical protein
MLSPLLYISLLRFGERYPFAVVLRGKLRQSHTVTRHKMIGIAKAAARESLKLKAHRLKLTAL